MAPAEGRLTTLSRYASSVLPPSESHCFSSSERLMSTLSQPSTHLPPTIRWMVMPVVVRWRPVGRSEEHTSELQSRQYLVCRLLLEKKKYQNSTSTQIHVLRPNQRIIHVSPISTSLRTLSQHRRITIHSQHKALTFISSLLLLLNCT